MPAGAVEGRSEQLALVAGLLHEHGTDPRIGELLAVLEGSPLLADPDSPPAVNVRELRRDYERYVRLPRKLVQDLARTTAVAQRAWSAAREARTSRRFRPHLERIVELKRAEAQCVGYEREPYDALIDDYEPGITSEIVGRLFDALRRELVPLAGAHRGREPAAGRGDAPAPGAARGPAQVRGARRRGGGLRFRSRPARSRGPPLLHQPWAGRLPHRTPFRSSRLRGGRAHRPPRGRAWALRAGARLGVLRNTDGRGRLGGDGRVAGAALGEPGGAQPGVLGALPSAGAAIGFPRRWATWTSTSSTSR